MLNCPQATLRGHEAEYRGTERPAGDDRQDAEGAQGEPHLYSRHISHQRAPKVQLAHRGLCQADRLRDLPPHRHETEGAQVRKKLRRDLLLRQRCIFLHKAIFPNPSHSYPPCPPSEYYCPLLFYLFYRIFAPLWFFPFCYILYLVQIFAFFLIPLLSHRYSSPPPLYLLLFIFHLLILQTWKFPVVFVLNSGAESACAHAMYLVPCYINLVVLLFQNSLIAYLYRTYLPVFIYTWQIHPLYKILHADVLTKNYLGRWQYFKPLKENKWQNSGSEVHHT